MTGDALVLERVSVTFAGAEQPVLREVDLRIEHGELAVVVGRTGSGKSTLLGTLNGMVPHFTGGTLRGSVRVEGRDTAHHRPRDLADVVGMVGQDPLAGFVTDTVEEELAYGMEQLGLGVEVMRKRIEETLDVMGIADLRDRPLRALSGGQQQRVAIGAVLAAHPRILVLDEPTSALDPTGAEEVLASITRLVHDLAVTVVLAEHRIERVLQYADRVIVVEDGLVRSGDPAEMMRTSPVAPPVVELGRWADWSPLPLSVRDAWRRARDLREQLGAGPERAAEQSSAPVLTARGISVAYSPGEPVVDDVSCDLGGGSVTALMGRNGSGKSSLLWALQGTGARQRGRVEVAGVDPAEQDVAARRALVGLVPQTPADLLYLPSVGQELAQADSETGSDPGSTRALLDRLVPGVGDEQHPRDLSEGQRLALVLAIQLAARPRVLLLDEPTRGLDYPGKAALAALLRELAGESMAVLLSTHDVEFTAAVADRVLVLAGGEVVASGPTAEVVVSSPTFAPQVAKVLGHGWLTVDQVRGTS